MPSVDFVKWVVTRRPNIVETKSKIKYARLALVNEDSDYQPVRTNLR